MSSPLFRDPIHDGAADPTIIWNRQEKTWWILYTNRRANVDTRGVAWVHGTDIGIASSADGGKTWIYRGILPNLEFEPGRNTFWAPEVLWHADLYHMYVSYVRGIPHNWSGERRILHMTSPNLWEWKLESILRLSSNFVIDACVHRLADVGWRLWFKDEANQSHTFAADSPDLYTWTVAGPVITDCPHEGPNVFFWKGSSPKSGNRPPTHRYWMVTDFWHGLGVYHSNNAMTWFRQANILDQPGIRPDDGNFGHHADVLVQGEHAFIFYFTHPQPGPRRTLEEVTPYAERRSSLHVAELELQDGQIVCNRDKDLVLQLEPPSD